MEVMTNKYSNSIIKELLITIWPIDLLPHEGPKKHQTPQCPWRFIETTLHRLRRRRRRILRENCWKSLVNMLYTGSWSQRLHISKPLQTKQGSKKGIMQKKLGLRSLIEALLSFWWNNMLYKKLNAIEAPLPGSNQQKASFPTFWGAKTPCLYMAFWYYSLNNSLRSVSVNPPAYLQLLKGFLSNGPRIPYDRILAKYGVRKASAQVHWQNDLFTEDCETIQCRHESNPVAPWMNLNITHSALSIAVTDSMISLWHHYEVHLWNSIVCPSIDDSENDAQDASLSILAEAMQRVAAFDHKVEQVNDSGLKGEKYRFPEGSLTKT